MASSATAAQRPLRIVSRRAQRLLQQHRATRRGGRPDGAAAKRAPPKEDDTPWPMGPRLAFYAVCAAAVPFSLGQAIAMSPRLRAWLGGDDVAALEEDGGGAWSSGRLVALVRRHWGSAEYAPPVDRPAAPHAAPGHRYPWQEDNAASFWRLVGRTTTEDSEREVPMSLDNEPPAQVRREQALLARYLATATNPTGVATRLVLLPGGAAGGMGEAGYETTCTLPASTPAAALRAPCQGSEAQGRRRDLMEADPAFAARATDETLRTKSWNEDCRWMVSFADADDEGGDTGGESVGGDVPVEAFGQTDAPRTSSQELRRMTAIRSSWSVPEGDPAAAADAAASPPTAGAAPPPPREAAAAGDPAAAALRHRIAALERELRDTASLRDRDVMALELRAAQRELRASQPWWRRALG